jgi:hypothetical protein
LAVSTAGTAAAAFAQDAALEVTLQVLDDVTAIEGVLMPLEEEPAHGTEAGADSTPAPEVSAPTPEASPADEPAVEVVR